MQRAHSLCISVTHLLSWLFRYRVRTLSDFRLANFPSGLRINKLHRAWNKYKNEYRD